MFKLMPERPGDVDLFPVAMRSGAARQIHRFKGGKHAAGKGTDGATRPPPPPPRKCGDPLGLYPPCE